MMKLVKTHVFMWLSVVLLTACASSQNTTQKMLKPIVEYQCEQELKSSKIWHASTLVLGEAKRDELKDQACECVADHALKNIPAQQIAQAMMDDEAKNKLVKQAVMNSIRGCILNLKD